MGSSTEARMGVMSFVAIRKRDVRWVAAQSRPMGPRKRLKSETPIHKKKDSAPTAKMRQIKWGGWLWQNKIYKNQHILP